MKEDAGTNRALRMSYVFLPVAQNPKWRLSVGGYIQNFLGKRHQDKGPAKRAGKRRDGPKDPSLLIRVSRELEGYLWNRFRADPCLNHSI